MRRVSLLWLLLLIAVVPTMHRTAALTQSFGHQASAHALGKVSGSPRVPAVIAISPVVAPTPQTVGLAASDHGDVAPGFPSPPFIPPRD
jgi:hypothetical protein